MNTNKKNLEIVITINDDSGKKISERIFVDRGVADKPAIIVPLVKISDAKKSAKNKVQFYSDDNTLEFFKEFMKVNRLKPSQAMNHILKSFFGIKI